ncbi:hypothetical protein FNH05_35350 [Amycolatopsis rhizosphaerae]|uniref:Uncharacterized protein n=1 Tax=Amycolatopsis rhizosphaerae TaxID=2053003 RepID=A0A558A3G1_9PSEU|nr:hypothetical protein FNH05_35350 [Amycolatopsis rhizosphaerae]
MMLLVPADLLRPRRADDHFAAEADAAREAGVEVTLVDHDALTTPGGAGEGSQGDAPAVHVRTAVAVQGEDRRRSTSRSWPPPRSSRSPASFAQAITDADHPRTRGSGGTRGRSRAGRPGDRPRCFGPGEVQSEDPARTVRKRQAERSSRPSGP